jgi:hypothetical protein
MQRLVPALHRLSQLPSAAWPTSWSQVKQVERRIESKLVRQKDDFLFFSPLCLTVDAVGHNAFFAFRLAYLHKQLSFNVSEHVSGSI